MNNFKIAIPVNTYYCIIFACYQLRKLILHIFLYEYYHFIFITNYKFLYNKIKFVLYSYKYWYILFLAVDLKCIAQFAAESGRAVGFITNSYGLDFNILAHNSLYSNS